MKFKIILAFCSFFGIIIILQSKPPVPNNLLTWNSYIDYDTLYNLGKVLFNSPMLSSGQQYSCANCHKEEFCFADTIAFNKGINGQLLTKNTLPLVYLSNTKRNIYFWSGAVDSLETAIDNHLKDMAIMGLTDSILNRRIESNKKFNWSAIRAATQPPINTRSISVILANYLRYIPLYKPSYDDRILNKHESVSNKIYTALSLCWKCHKNTFEVEGISNNGLDKNDTSLYIIPPLSNLKYTAPYMHDGRFKTLEEVIEHYNSGIKISAKTDPLLYNKKKPIQLKLSKEEVRQMAILLYSIERKNRLF